MATDVAGPFRFRENPPASQTTLSAIRLILALAAGFAIGAAFAWPGHRAPLGSMIEKQPAPSTASRSEGIPSAYPNAGAAGSAEAVFSRVLSAVQGGTW